MKINLHILIITLTMFIYSCSSTGLEPKKFIGYSKIKQGETAYISWDFDDVDSVKVHGFEQNYKSKDVLAVSPRISRSYTIKAYKDNDSLTMNSLVEVEKIKEPGAIVRGPKTLKEIDIAPSYAESEYMRGIIEAGKFTNPEVLKIMETSYEYGKNKYSAKVIFLDQFGNFLSGFSSDNKDTRLAAINRCDQFRTTNTIKDYKMSGVEEGDGIDIAISMDNSSTTVNFSNLLFQSIKNSVEMLSPDDNLHFSYYNQNYVEEIPLASAESSVFALNNLEIPNSSGMNGMYRAAFNGIKDLKRGVNENKAFVLITSNHDNSSIIYHSNDIVKLAIAGKIPIYIIAIGSAVDTYTLKYLSNITGGRFYSVDLEDIYQVENILMEIMLSGKIHYEFDVSLLNSADKCNDIDIEILFQENERQISEEKSLKTRLEVHTSLYQALALFNPKEAIVKKEYNNILQSLANVLKDNPDQKIQLIGHGSIEGNNEMIQKLSLERAKNVEKKLIEMGANKKQIKVKGEGASKPLYYMQTQPWQQQLNRRVEIKWLDPSVLPYEIVTEIKATEDDANNLVEKWEDRGYRSYYDRYLQNNNPYYRVKLWGYSTEDEVKREIKELKDEFKGKYEID